MSLKFDAQTQFVFLLISIILWLSSIIICLFSHLSKLAERGKVAIALGWLVIAVFTFETLGSIVNFQLRADIAKNIQNTAFAHVTYNPEGLLVLDGLIGDTSTDSLVQQLAIHGKKPLFINSGGGSLEAALAMADIVRQQQLTVIVAQECSSACVLIAIASNNLMALPEAKFGFHQGSIFGDADQSGMAKFWAQTANKRLMQALQDGGIPDSILAIAKKTPPEEMYYVSARKMRSLKIVKTILK